MKAYNIDEKKKLIKSYSITCHICGKVIEGTLKKMVAYNFSVHMDKKHEIPNSNKPKRMGK